MRLKHDRQAQIRVIEAIMASLIVVFAVTVVNLFAITPASPKYEAGELEKIGYNVLHDLDEQRLLTRFVYNEEWENLTAALAASLPTDVYFNLTVYDMEGRAVNDQTIGYGSNRVFTGSSYVGSVSYIVPGYRLEYRSRVLLLQLVRG